MGIFGFKEKGNTNADGSFRGHIRYDARDGIMSRVDRVQGVQGWESRLVDITATAMFVADIPNIKPGWVKFGNQGPVKVLGKLGAVPDQPDDPEFKEGFELLLILHPSCGNPEAKEEVRELVVNAKCVMNAMDELTDRIMRMPEIATGKLPILRLDPDIPVMPVKTGSGARASTNYAPRFVVMGWVDRPASLAAPAAVEPRQEAFPNVNGGRQRGENTPPATGGQKVNAPPPPPAPKPAPVTISADDFG